jgi:NAD+ kinase
MHASTEPSPTTREPGRARRAFVITHGRAETVGNGLRRLAAVASEHGVELVVPEIEAQKHPEDLARTAWSTGGAAGTDIVVVLGGDGTTLRALHEVIGSPTPVLAINYGRVGFLTTATVDGLEQAAVAAFTGAFQVVELPTIELVRGGERLGLAVNDVVVTSAIHGRMAHVRWSVNDVPLGEMGCDGVVVATPAGSTAYSLSAGGPVMNWGLEGFCVTFVAPHSLGARSLVLGPAHRVAIENASVDVDARLILDGQVQRHALAPGERFESGLAKETARLALLPGVSFLQRFRNTFGR